MIYMGDFNGDGRFDQLDLVKVQIAAKYLAAQAATWGEGDWNGAPGGNPGNPQQGWGVFLKGAVSDGNPNYVQNSIIAGIGGTGLFRGRELDSFGVGYFYYDLSDALQETLSPRRERLSDEQGVEVYYSYAVTPWFYMTGDFQIIDPPRNVRENAVIAGLRANIRF